MDRLADKNTKVLLLVAHPDDEIIFCGGTMLLYPECQWSVVSMTDDGRPEAFNNSIENLKKLGVNIVYHKTLGQENVPINSKIEDLATEKQIWEKVLREQNFSPDITITHNVNGEYGHGAHKLLSKVADSIFSNVWKFGYPKSQLSVSDKKIEIHLSEEILQKKKELFNTSYPSEQYIWKALRSVMDYEFKDGPEIFISKNTDKIFEKKKILVMIPDRFVRSSGGIGANSGPVFSELSSEYDFYVVGYPLLGTDVPDFVKAYKEVSNPFTEVRSGVVGTIISQVRYLKAGISLPRPDLVFAFDWSIYLAAVEAAEYFGVPLVARMSMSPILLSEQGYTFGLDLSRPLEKALHDSFCEMEIRGLKEANTIIQVSKNYSKMYEHIAPNFIPKTRLVIDGIKLEKWQAENIGKMPLPGTGKKKIIFLGRLSEVKGIIPLCEAKVPEEINLIFIGPQDTADAVCLKAIQEKIKKEKNVYFLGALYGDEKIRALKSADAIVMPSYHESFGGVGLEGLAAGCIVLSSRVYGLSDFLDDKTSIYCGTQAADIQKAYQVFLAMSEEQKNNMRQAGFEVCKTLTIDKTAQSLKNVFEELI